MPGACRSCPRAHKLLCARLGKFQYGHALIFPTVCISFTGLVQVLAGHVKIFAGQVNFQNHVPNGHVNHMLNVKPCPSTEQQWIWNYACTESAFCIIFTILHLYHALWCLRSSSSYKVPKNCEIGSFVSLHSYIDGLAQNWVTAVP